MVNTLKSAGLVTHQILDQIFKGTIKSGDRLPSAENISKQSGVSIISAREALKSLEAIGLVKIVHGKGIYVTDGGPIVEEMLDTRKMLECHNVERAALKIADEDLHELVRLIEEMEAAMFAADPRSFSDLDHEFHMLIAKVAGNRFLFKVFETTKNLLFYQQSMVNRYPGNPEVAIRQHRVIVKAFAGRDPASARAAMADHLDEALRVFKKSIDERVIAG